MRRVPFVELVQELAEGLGDYGREQELLKRQMEAARKGGAGKRA